MRKPKAFALSLFVVFTVAVAAAGQARITSAVLGQDRILNAGHYEIVKPTTEFRPDSAKIACVFTVEGARLGTVITSVWIAEDVGDQAPPNFKIDEKTLPLP
ncbi:MAG: hypothetical protein ACRD1V_15835, partial [Vicinamibacterales bacterium]